MREAPSVCRILGGDNHPVGYTILYTIFYKTHDKRGYSSHSTQFFDLYTYKNANNPHSVDNTVDNVDKTPRFLVFFLLNTLHN